MRFFKITVLIGLFLIISIGCIKIFSFFQSSPKLQVLGEFQEQKNNKSYAWFLVSDTSSLRYIPNYQTKLTANEVKTNNGCSALVSGGFYSTIGNHNYPLGLIINEGKLVNEYRKAQLLDGIYSINNFFTSRITRDLPKDSLRTAVQSGPLLIENNLIQKLHLVRDEPARRIIVGITGENQTIFIVFFNPTSVFIGPKLADLSEKLDQFQKETGIQIADALNLDGGTASVFITEDLKLPEASLAGGFFLC